MKWIGKCKKCKKDFECTKENEDHDYKSKFPIHRYRCYHCDHLDSYELEGMRYEPFTIDEAVKMVKDLKEGRDNKYVIGRVDLKVGHEKKCKKCGKITDVVVYNGCMDYNENCSTVCSCEEKSYLEDWFEPCDDKDCEFHKRIDAKKFRDERDDYAVRDDIIEQIFEAYPPENDGAIELDRIAHMFDLMYGKDSINGCRAYVFDRFIRYCAEKELLTK